MTHTCMLVVFFYRWLHDPVNVALENVQNCEYFSGGCSCTSAGGYDADCGVPQFKPDYLVRALPRKSTVTITKNSHLLSKPNESILDV